jgi:hypothetical protein
MITTTNAPGKLLPTVMTLGFAPGNFGTGRSPTFVPVMMNFVSGDAGACGAVIFWKHVGHSMTVPLCDESHIMCWPQTGQAYLNSLMATPKHFTSALNRQCGFSSFRALQKNSLRLGVFESLR